MGGGVPRMLVCVAAETGGTTRQPWRPKNRIVLVRERSCRSKETFLGRGGRQEVLSLSMIKKLELGPSWTVRRLHRRKLFEFGKNFDEVKGTPLEKTCTT